MACLKEVGSFGHPPSRVHYATPREMKQVSLKSVLRSGSMDDTHAKMLQVAQALERKPKLFAALFTHLIDSYTFVMAWEESHASSARYLMYEDEPVGLVYSNGEGGWTWEVSYDAANTHHHGTEKDRQAARDTVDALLREEGWILG